MNVLAAHDTKAVSFKIELSIVAVLIYFGQIGELIEMLSTFRKQNLGSSQVFSNDYFILPGNPVYSYRFRIGNRAFRLWQ